MPLYKIKIDLDCCQYLLKGILCSMQILRQQKSSLMWLNISNNMLNIFWSMKILVLMPPNPRCKVIGGFLSLKWFLGPWRKWHCSESWIQLLWGSSQRSCSLRYPDVPNIFNLVIWHKTDWIRGWMILHKIAVTEELLVCHLSGLVQAIFSLNVWPSTKTGSTCYGRNKNNYLSKLYINLYYIKRELYIGHL